MDAYYGSSLYDNTAKKDHIINVYSEESIYPNSNNIVDESRLAYQVIMPGSTEKEAYETGKKIYFGSDDEYFPQGWDLEAVNLAEYNL